MNPKGTTIIVMEFIQEGSLDRYLHVNQATIDYPKQLFGYAQNIADGMEYLGQNNIIHRDLAARNILVADQETVKISDFGLARVATNDFYQMHSNSNIPVRWEAVEWLSKLDNGLRLPQTELCPNHLYSRVMLACWNRDPAVRPTFRELKIGLRQAELEVT